MSGRSRITAHAALWVTIVFYLSGCGSHSIISHNDGYEDDLDASEGCRAGFGFVPEGDFIMGADEGDDETPQHTVFQSSYCISEREVTNGEWKDCVSAGACTEPHDLSSVTREDYYLNPAYSDHPVIHVDWYQAQEYCRWIGGDLPTESQWEKAARGGCEIRGSASSCEDEEDEPTYPWGEAAPGCELSNFCSSYPYSCCVGDTDTAGSREPGASCYRIINLSGNVAEWVRDWYDADYYENGGPPWIDPGGPASGFYRIIRGGSWEFDIGILPVHSRVQYGPSMSTEYIGLRCVTPVE
jgi:formylglycine-generating enzyme required for sulfatase activity